MVFSSDNDALQSLNLSCKLWLQVTRFWIHAHFRGLSTKPKQPSQCWHESVLHYWRYSPSREMFHWSYVCGVRWSKGSSDNLLKKRKAFNSIILTDIYPSVNISDTDSLIIVTLLSVGVCWVQTFHHCAAKRVEWSYTIGGQSPDSLSSQHENKQPE